MARTATTDRLRDAAHRVALAAERGLERVQAWRDDGSPPDHLRIVAYLGHGTADEVVVRGRVLDDPEPADARAGEGAWASMRRMARRFATDELPGVELAIELGDTRVETSTDEEGYFDVHLRPDLPVDGDPWREATVDLATPFRGIPPGRAAVARIRVPDPDGDVGFISDVDDTVLQTGAQRLWEMVRVTATGSALTRTPFPGVPELYRALEAGTGGPARPFFYVSSSPWNLHGFLTAFLDHRDIPAGPLLLRDLGIDQDRFISSDHGDHKLDRISEVLELHPDLDMVLIGDSGQKDPRIYAEVVSRHPGRIRAVWIREVRLDQGDHRIEQVEPTFHDAGVPMVLAADSRAFADHAVELGLVAPEAARRIAESVATELAEPGEGPVREVTADQR